MRPEAGTFRGVQRLVNRADKTCPVTECSNLLVSPRE